MEIIEKIALVLTIIGGINWLLIGIFDINIVSTIISNKMIDNIIYIIIGVASLISINYLIEEKRS